jgi:hypothetical protein
LIGKASHLPLGWKMAPDYALISKMRRMVNSGGNRGRPPVYADHQIVTIRTGSYQEPTREVRIIPIFILLLTKKNYW